MVRVCKKYLVRRVPCYTVSSFFFHFEMYENAKKHPILGHVVLTYRFICNSWHSSNFSCYCHPTLWEPKRDCVKSDLQSFRNAGVGNVLWFCGSASETASVDNITHAMFVTDVTDKRPGETLTASDVFIAANTSRSNGAYEPLSTYKPNYTDKNYIDGKVYGGNYAASF